MIDRARPRSLDLRSIPTPSISIGPAPLVVGDLTVVAGFVVYGLLFHGIHPLEFPSYTVSAAVPFLIAWLVVSPLTGAYARRTRQSVRQMLLVVGVTWLLASLVGGAIRATPYFHGGAPPSFLLVNVVFGLAFLLPWRLAVVLVSRGRSRHA